jgi:hypothetical protein
MEFQLEADYEIDLTLEAAREPQPEVTPEELVQLHKNLWAALNAVEQSWGAVKAGAVKPEMFRPASDGARATLQALESARNLGAMIDRARAALVQARDLIDESWVAAETVVVRAAN